MLPVPRHVSQALCSLCQSTQKEEISEYADVVGVSYLYVRGLRGTDSLRRNKCIDRLVRKMKERQTDRKTNRQTDRQKGRKKEKRRTNRQTERKRKFERKNKRKKTDRQTDIIVD